MPQYGVEAFRDVSQDKVQNTTNCGEGNDYNFLGQKIGTRNIVKTGVTVNSSLCNACKSRELLSCRVLISSL